MAILNKGQILTQGNPRHLVSDMQGKVWEKVIEREELSTIAKSHKVISDRFYDGQTLVRIISDEEPGTGFVSTTANLEDVYFSHINHS
jgi:ABC-type multidrug transport system ATPase subunit